MSGGFNDPIVGGGGALVYPSIHSPNFITGVSGWTIKKDGSAEFDNLTIRGTFNGLDFIINASGLFFYSGTPAASNLIASIAPVAGTDPFGTHVNAGITSADLTFGGVTNILGAIITLSSGVTKRAVLSPGHLTVFNSSGATIYDVDMARAAQFLYADTGSATQGALIASQSQNSGTDQFGNAYDAGITDYTSGQAVNLSGGAIQFFAAANLNNPSVAQGATQALNLASGTSSTLGNQASLQLIPSAGVAQALLTGTLVAAPGGTPETFHNLGLVNGWTGTARYRLLPDGRVELDLALSAAAATAFQFSTMPVGYRPTASRFLAAGCTANLGTAVAPRVQVDSTGVISMLGLSSFSTASTWVAGGSFPLN